MGRDLESGSQIKLRNHLRIIFMSEILFNYYQHY